MGVTVHLQTTDESPLSAEAIRTGLEQGLGGGKFTGARLLFLIPDSTRTIPLPMLFRMLVEIVADAKQIDFLIALGTHPPMSDAAICTMVGLTEAERTGQYARIGLLNHAWDDPKTLKPIGVLTVDQVKSIAGSVWHSSLGGDVEIRINRLIDDYDQVIILGPTFPHEVVGFSGGAKYLFPGISGPEMINVTHWLSALNTAQNTIGIKDTPVRRMIHVATESVRVPLLLVALVVEKDATLSGLFIGDHLSAWSAAADFSAQRHIIWSERSYHRVLSHAPPMYDELWTGAKAMYKLEPAVATGGELIIYAPHLDTVSVVHGKYIYEIGYHVRDYFLHQWDRFKHIPLGVLAHSNHVRGAGLYESGVETPRIQVTLTSKISKEDCARLNLGYLDPATIRISDYQDREAEGVLYVPKAGEILYRVRG
jgi:nickel-dependent lactate racemase